MSAKKKTALVTGAGGFIGGWLSHYLAKKGYEVVGTDIKQQPDYRVHPGPWRGGVDLRDENAAWKLMHSWHLDEVYHLAANMGGIGWISSNHAEITRDNTLIDLHVIDAAARYPERLDRFFYSSSACVYNTNLQRDAEGGYAALHGLAEKDAWPADPEPGYGLEKLLAEKLCEYYAKDRGLCARIARFHNVGGQYGTYDGGREKAPAALCRKVALAKDGGEIEIWGDGQQTRSFLYAADVCEGIYRLTQLAENPGPLNIGSDRMVTIDELARMAIAASGKKLTLKHVDGPQGVRSRNSDNTLAEKTLGGWKPEWELERWMAYTYQWIEHQVEGRAR